LIYVSGATIRAPINPANANNPTNEIPTNDSIGILLASCPAGSEIQGHNQTVR
jgi:hypothetical protein